MVAPRRTIAKLVIQTHRQFASELTVYPLSYGQSRRRHDMAASSACDAYDTALARLAQLQSNRAITSLFDTPAPAAAAGDSSKPPIDLNSLAIPEMLDWLRRAGYTPASLAASPLRFVHVAGTKGKGSVSALVASILHQYRDRGAGRVGLYTSPHVVSVRERIVLDCKPISQDKLARYVGEVWDRLTEAARREAEAKGLLHDGPGGVSEEELRGPGTKPFYFRFLTLAALHAFASEPGFRSAVVECGIGGEYDATNVLPAESVTAAVVTQLGIDHVGMLGNTVEKIAWHKSGVFKPGVKAFTRRLRDDQGQVMEVLRERAREKGAVLVEVADEEVERWGGVDGARLQGPFQKYNMAVAVHAAREHLLQIGVGLEGRFGTDEWSLSDIPPEFVKGLREASLRGRCEVLRDAEGIEWHVDGAHTDDSLAGVGRWFAGRMGDVQNDNSVRVLLFNQQERDPAPLLKALLSGAQKGSLSTFSHAVFTRNEEQGPTAGEERDLSTQSKAQAIMQAVDATTATAVHSAVRPAVEHIRNIAAEARKEGKSCMVLATGSFHLVGAVLKTIDDHVEY